MLDANRGIREAPEGLQLTNISYAGSTGRSGAPLSAGHPPRKHPGLSGREDNGREQDRVGIENGLAGHVRASRNRSHTILNRAVVRGQGGECQRQTAFIVESHHGSACHGVCADMGTGSSQDKVAASYRLNAKNTSAYDVEPESLRDPEGEHASESMAFDPGTHRVATDELTWTRATAVLVGQACG